MFRKGLTTVSMTLQSYIQQGQETLKIRVYLQPQLFPGFKCLTYYLHKDSMSALSSHTLAILHTTLAYTAQNQPSKTEDFFSFLEQQVAGRSKQTLCQKADKMAAIPLWCSEQQGHSPVLTPVQPLKSQSCLRVSKLLDAVCSISMRLYDLQEHI